MTLYTRLYLSLRTSVPESWIRPLYKSVKISELSKCTEDVPHAYTTESSSYWCPIYLSKKALVSFLVIFSALAAGIQILLLLSNRNSGLSGVNDGPHRVLWTYGPTALLTLVASFWARVECQSKIIAPWIKMKRGFATAQQSLFLDYLSQFQLLSIISAIRNKDYTVAAVTFISVLIKALLVLSTSLFVLSPTEIIRSNVPLTLKSNFVNSPSGLAGSGSLAFANFASMVSMGTSSPPGTSDKYAYQLIESDFLDTPSAISTALDGFNGDLDCEPAALPASGTCVNAIYDHMFPIWSNSCRFDIRLDDAVSSIEPSNHFVSLQPGGCGGSSNVDDQRLAIIIAVTENPAGYNNKTGHYDNVTISSSISFLCKPTYQIYRLDFSAQGPDRSVSKSSTVDSRVLSNVHPWSIMYSLLRATPEFPANTRNTGNMSGQRVFFSSFGFLAYLLANASGGPPELSTIFEDREGAKKFVSSYYQQYSALLAHASLMQPISSPSEGTVSEIVDRFLVRDLIANTTSGILALCILMVSLIAIFDRSTSFLLPQRLSSIIGFGACLSSSHALLDKFRGFGSTGYPTLRGFLDGWLYRICPANAKGNVGICTKECLAANDELEMREPENSVFKPASLSFTARVTVALFLVAIATTLEVTLRISMRSNGLGDVPSESRYISYLWTTLPTVIFTLINMYCSSADFDTRSLAPFLHLVQGSGFESSVGLDLINKHSLLLFYGELRSRSFEAMASTLAVILTSFLTIFSAGLFSGIYVAAAVPSQLHVADFVWYQPSGTEYAGYPDYALATAALILAANMTYPSFTYEDLVLPKMTVDEEFLTSHPNSSGIGFSGTFPAARPSFANCRLYNSSQIRLDFDSWSVETARHVFPGEPGIPVIIEPENCFGNRIEGQWNLKIDLVSRDAAWAYTPGYFSSIPANAYFGLGVGNDGYSAQGCSQRFWAWGRWTSEGGNESFPEVVAVAALACNESMETVSVSASLFGPDLTIDPKVPPIANESTKSSVNLGSEESLFYNLYDSIPPLSTNATDRLFDTFFTLLTTSRYALPLEKFSNESEASAVADVVQFHHRVIVAQKISAIQGLEYTEMREFGYEIVPGTNGTSSYNVTGSIPSSRHRVVQDELSTRFLQALLAAALICCLLNSCLIHSAGGCQMVPRKPNTIANVAALLADSNIIENLPSDDVDISASKRAGKRFGRLKDCVFRLGWRELDGQSEQVYSIYVSSTE